MIVYKAVYVRFDELWSVIHEDKLGVGVRYIPGVESVAPHRLAKQGYHLCVFDTLENAELFGEYCCVWEAEAREEVPLPPYGHPWEDGTVDVIDNACWPTGTKMYKGVTLTRQVMNGYHSTG